MKRMSLFIACLLAISAGLHAESMVWVAEKDGETVYICGSMHLLRQSDFPIPVEFTKAFEAADIVILEADVSSLTSPEVQQKILAEAMLPDGEGLDDILSDEAYALLETYCVNAGLPLSELNQFKPSMVLLTITTLELSKMGITQEYGIDVYFSRRAVGEGKEMSYLESVEEQIEFLMSIGEGYESELVIQSLNDLEETQEQIEQMIKCWKTGDAKGLYNIVLVELKRDYPVIYKTLFLDRNDKWMSSIEKLFLTEEDEFVLVGAGHLVGEEGVISQLKERGYSVKKLK